MTLILTNGLTADGDSAGVQVQAGQYLFAASGTFGGGTLKLMVSIGPDVVAPISEIAYIAADSDIVWLPNCVVHVNLSGATSPNVAAALAEVSAKVAD